MQTLHLRPYSQGERRGIKEDFATWIWELKQAKQKSCWNEYTRSDYIRMLAQTDYPEVSESPQHIWRRWMDNYIDLVVSRDVSEVTGIIYPDRLKPLLQLIASQGCAEFNAASVSRDLDIPSRSVPAYLRALESVYLIDIIPAWGHNLGRRVISKPKVFASDTGMAMALARLDEDSLLQDISSAFTGGLLESFVGIELLKQRTWSQTPYDLFHFRDSRGHEVDFVMEGPRREIVGIEVKATSTLNPRHFSGLEYLKEAAGKRFRSGVVLYTGSEAVRFEDRLWAMPIASLWS